MKFRIVIEYDAVAEAFSAVCPELPGSASAGNTEDEAKQNIEEAIRLYLWPSDVEIPRDAKLYEVTVGCTRNTAAYRVQNRRRCETTRIRARRTIGKPSEVAESCDIETRDRRATYR